MHILSVGISDSGKSNLNKALAKKYADKGQNIIIYDPLSSAGWGDNAQKYSDPYLFFEYIRKAQNAYVFIDEGKTLWDADEKEADKILYKGRHRGLLIFLMAQRANMIRPNARNQCSTLYAFKQVSKDTDLLIDDFGDAVEGLPQLQPNHFIFSNGFKSAEYYLDYSKVPDRTGRVPPEIKLVNTNSQN